MPIRLGAKALFDVAVQVRFSDAPELADGEAFEHPWRNRNRIEKRETALLTDG
jgi:hypothetical protein